ncbi:unnamed protein product [Gemmata massiliana]|uniref:Uncharacterized protein n=1 Tax=Gemmata massiliana TaxID=1210884 RepID=A0A6P2CXU6_9BACT|nr:hypothetical protein [Gemmata massiliana]VTR93206.1 unnamed protein product [Gemmata massiliana]
MSELSKALGATGPEHQIVHEGRAYTFHLLDQTRKNALEKRLYQQAREAVYVDRDHMTEDQYLARLDRVREAYERNEYAFFGARCTEILQTPKGALMLLEVITSESEDDLTPVLSERGPEVNAVLKTVMDESFRKVRARPQAPEVPRG